MAYQPYQPYNNYPYQPSYGNYAQGRFDPPMYGASPSPQNQPQNAVGQPPVPSMPSPTNGFSCRPVTSREEAVAIQTDFLSPGTIMPDLGHNMIYMKRFNTNTGASDFFEFSLLIPQTEEAQDKEEKTFPDYSENFKDFGERIDILSDRLEELSEKLDRWKIKQSSQKGASKE